MSAIVAFVHLFQGRFFCYKSRDDIICLKIDIFIRAGLLLAAPIWEIETDLPEIDTTLPEIDTSLPEIETTLP